MSWIRTALELFALQSKIKLQALMQYRGDFLFGILMTFGFSAMGPLFQFLIYTRTKGYPGWDFNQILLFQGVLLLSNGIWITFLGDIRLQIDQLMEKGEFDRLLLKPFPPLLYILTGGFSPYSLGTLLVGIAAVAWAWTHSGTAPTLGAFVLFLLFLAAGLMLYLASIILYCTLTVRWVYTLRLPEIMDKVLHFGDFPLDIYPLILQTVFITVLPFSVSSYWPAQALLGRVWTGAWPAIGATLALCLFFALAWRGQLKRYTSAGG